MVSLVMALIFLKLAQYFNKKHNEKFFEKEEPYFLALAMFLSGSPGWFLYLILILVASLLFAISHSLLAKKFHRVSYYNFWLPLGLLAIALDRILLAYWPFYTNFVFAL